MLKTYPFDSFRPGTEEAIKQIDDAFDSGKRFVLVHAPTGSGKSGIAVAFARKYKSVILTPTKILQTQYAETPQFNKEWTLFGKASYTCGLPDFDSSVEEAICCSDKLTFSSLEYIPFPTLKTIPDEKGSSKSLKVLCSDSGLCPYYSKLDRISSTPGAIINYDLFFKIKEGVPSSKGRYLGDSVVFDEAHQLIAKASSNFGHLLTNTGAKKLLGDHAGRLHEEGLPHWFNRLIHLCELQVVRATDPKVINKTKNYASRLSLLKKLGVFNPDLYHIRDSFTEVEIKPLSFESLKDVIFNPFRKILLLSATIPSDFCNLFGISENECEVIHIDSCFPKKNRPVVYPADIASLNYKSVLDTDSDQYKLLNLVLDAHKDEKGMVHCGSYKFFDQLKVLYKDNPRFIWVNQDMNKDEFIKFHSASKLPTILVSPSLMEGLDLKDDLCRWQFLLKMPYPALDDYTKQMDALHPGWYQGLVAMAITQAYGRAVRTEEDRAVFYIADGSFKMLFSKYRRVIPPYLLEAIQKGKLETLMAYLQKKAENV